MLDYSFIEERYNTLSQPEKKDLLFKLFGDNKQSITYFKRIKDPGMTKLETLADFFDVPLDNLRVENTNKSTSRNNCAVQDPRYEYFKAMSELADKEDQQSLLIHKVRQAMDEERNLRRLTRKRQ